MTYTYTEYFSHSILQTTHYFLTQFEENFKITYIMIKTSKFPLKKWWVWYESLVIQKWRNDKWSFIPLEKIFIFCFLNLWLSKALNRCQNDFRISPFPLFIYRWWPRRTWHYPILKNFKDFSVTHIDFKNSEKIHSSVFFYR